MSLVDRLRVFFLQHGVGQTYWIAYSGGMDSHVLLSLCVELQQELSLHLKVIHIHHGLSKHADAWVQHCREICHAYHVEFFTDKISLTLPAGASVEETARKQRYDVFARYLSDGDFLLTAHHQDDQAETLMIQLFRGAGPKGLAAMPEVKQFGSGYHARPLLHMTRDELQDYASTLQLHWIQDESNENTSFSRNFIRHDVMPVIKSRWPSVSRSLARSAAHCANMQVIVDEYTAAMLHEVKGSRENLLSVARLLKLDSNKQRLLIRAWIMASGHELPDAKKLNAMIENVLLAGWDRMPCVKWGRVELRRYRDDLYLLTPAQRELELRQYHWDLHTDLELPGLGKLIARPVADRGLRRELSAVTIHFRDSFHRQHRLKNLYQQAGVPPWQRASIPIMTIGEEVVGIVGYYLNEKYMSTHDETGLRIELIG